jgi:hypothetical protein
MTIGMAATRLLSKFSPFDWAAITDAFEMDAEFMEIAS